MSDAPTATPDEAVSTPESPARHGCPLIESHGQAVLHPTREQYVGVVRALLDEGFEMCIDVTAVDYLSFMERPVPATVVPARLEVVATLLPLSAHERIRLRLQVPADDPSIDSLFDLHPGTEA